MATTIITKFGNGEPNPTDVAHGELAIDMQNSILYTKDGNGTIIQLGGGEVNWNQIIGIPEEITNIIDINAPGYINLDDLLALAKQNEADISRLETDLTTLAGRVTTNETNIITHDGRITTLENAINGTGGILERLGDIEADMVDMANDISTNAGNIASNKNEIDALRTLVEGGVTGLTLGGEYNAAQNWVENPTDAGQDVGLLNGQPLPAAESTKGFYVIVTTEGTLSGTGISKANGKTDGEIAYPGDWLISDGVHGWVLFQFHTDQTVWGQIGGTLTNQADLVAALDLKFDKDGGTLTCGRY